jgi:NADH-quinone oxidoreductase subunit L
MFRLLSLTFEGEQRWEARPSGEAGHHEGADPHEAPPAMTVPLVTLAILSAIGGLVGISPALGGGNAIEHWLEPVFARANDKLALATHGGEFLEWVLMLLSVGAAAGGIYVARKWYLKKKEIPERLAEQRPAWYKLLLNKYYIDETYDALVVGPVVKGSDKLLWRGIDVGVIDWCVNALPRAIGGAGRILRLLQTGVAQSYVFVFIVGVVVIIGWLIGR